MKPSGIGGMAVIEGVMMKNKDEYAVAVRKPNNEIAVEKKTHKDFAEKVKLFKLPIFRGMLAFVDSMVIGIKVLNFAASFFEEEEQQEPKKKNKKSKEDSNKKAAVADSKKKATKGKKKAETKGTSAAEELSAANEESDKSNALLMAAAVVVSLIISISFFMVLPVFISNLFARVIDSPFWLSLLEAVLRITIFIGYILVVSQMRDIKRVFMYHGAEHKTINCLENGFELTVENVRWQSKQHKRCGTSFMLLVMLISAIFFMVIQPETLLIRVVSRILLVPVIAGLSYEFIRLAGRSNSRIMDILSKPGLWMQGLTTKEPDDSMIEVAIQSVDAVFDWRAFLETSATSEETGKRSQSSTKGNKEHKNHTGHKEGSRLKNESDIKKLQTASSKVNVVTQAASVPPKPVRKNEEEDDEILKALDKYLDFEDKNASK